jgi:hypothetical protein
VRRKAKGVPVRFPTKGQQVRQLIAPALFDADVLRLCRVAALQQTGVYGERCSGHELSTLANLFMPV